MLLDIFADAVLQSQSLHQPHLSALSSSLPKTERDITLSTFVAQDIRDRPFEASFCKSTPPSLLCAQHPTTTTQPQCRHYTHHPAIRWISSSKAPAKVDAGIAVQSCAYASMLTTPDVFDRPLTDCSPVEINDRYLQQDHGRPQLFRQRHPPNPIPPSTRCVCMQDPQLVHQ